MRSQIISHSSIDIDSYKVCKGHPYGFIIMRFIRFNVRVSLFYLHKNIVSLIIFAIITL